jgi:oligopeptide transport system substrate-binding protein
MFMSNNGNNRTGWKSPEYDALLKEGNGEQDPERRMKLLRSAEALLIREEAPILPIYIYAGLEYYDPEVITGVYSNIRSEHPVRAIRKRARGEGVGQVGQAGQVGR